MIRSFSVLLSFVLFLGVALMLTFCGEQKKQAQQEKPSEYAAHMPDVKYVGSKTCQGCHAEIYDTYQHTGKGRSFYEPSLNNLIEDFSKAVVYDAPTNFYYRAFWRGPEMFISEYRLRGSDTIHYRQEKVDFVIGSGNQTRTYIREHNGYFFELPITWYVGKGIWDMSPGYEQGQNTRFDRPIGDMCMNCHNSEQQFVPFSINRFTTVGRGMSCEKCHGPGQAHVEAMQQGKSAATKNSIDYTIVNPARLPIQLQFDVCRQCHLEGITVPKPGQDVTAYRPGIPLAHYYDVFLPVSHNQQEFGFASHAERLQQAPCFINSAGKLNCTTCHDPHQPLPKDEVLFYNQKCQSCHQPAECSESHTLRAKAGDNCAGCHMPKSGTTDIPHVSSTDHFIRKTTGQKAATAPPAGKEVVTFRSFTSDVKEGERSFVLAHMIYFEQQERNPLYLDRISQYVHTLDTDNRIRYAYLKGSTSLPADLRGLQPVQVQNPLTASFVAEISRRGKRPQLAFAQRAVELAPDNVEFRSQLAQLQYETGNRAGSIETYEKIIALQPDHKMSLASLGFMYLEEGNFTKALQLTRKAIQADPDYLLPQENLVTIYLQSGELQKGLDQLNSLIQKHPGNQQYKALKERILQEM